MYLAVFGDVHGNLGDMYRYAQRWEQGHESQITAILQTGDMGVFRLEGPLDKATARYAKKDPSELGCADYIVGKKKASHLTLFVRGNHEDFDFLFGAGNTYIDPYGMIRHLRSGEVFTIEEGKERVHVSGLGGIAWGSRGFKGDCRKYFTNEEYECLLAMKQGSVDILLFHDAPEGYGLAGVPNTGAAEVTSIIEHLQPCFAFYGHYGNPPEPFYIGKTLCGDEQLACSALTEARRSDGDRRYKHLDF